MHNHARTENAEIAILRQQLVSHYDWDDATINDHDEAMDGSQVWHL
jgi:hypothetical protein